MKTGLALALEATLVLDPKPRQRQTAVGRKTNALICLQMGRETTKAAAKEGRRCVFLTICLRRQTWVKRASRISAGVELLMSTPVMLGIKFLFFPFLLLSISILFYFCFYILGFTKRSLWGFMFDKPWVLRQKTRHGVAFFYLFVIFLHKDAVFLFSRTTMIPALMSDYQTSVRISDLPAWISTVQSKRKQNACACRNASSSMRIQTASRSQQFKAISLSSGHVILERQMRFDRGSGNEVMRR